MKEIRSIKQLFSVVWQYLTAGRVRRRECQKQALEFKKQLDMHEGLILTDQRRRQAFGLDEARTWFTQRRKGRH
jgi:hypothetical protein